MEEIYVCKFGGTSVANANQIKKVEDILKQDLRRKVVVVSAPGKCKGRENKVTDLLYNLYFHAHPENLKNCSVNYSKLSLSSVGILDALGSIYYDISSDLGLDKSVVNSCFSELEGLLENPNSTPDDFASRGENFNARLIASYLKADFIDASELIYNPEDCIDGDNDITMHQMGKVLERLDNGKGLVVIPGFYGLSSLLKKKIRTFERGGSDLTGALVSAGLKENLSPEDIIIYENWTDQPGIKCCDPRLFSEAERKNIPAVSKISYKEARELTYMGFEVLNDKTIGPVKRTNVPIHIKDTNNPELSGTVVSLEYDHDHVVRGIAGRKGFCTINIEKYLIDEEIGFGRDIFGLIAYHGLSYEHAPSGIDDISVVLNQVELDKVKDVLVRDIQKKFSPDTLSFSSDLALIAIVGEGMKHQVGLANQATNALSNAKVNIEIINQGSSENNMIFGVKEADYEKAIRALYFSLIEKK